MFFVVRKTELAYIVNVKINLTFTIIILLILPCTSVPCGHSVHIGTGERKNIFFVHYKLKQRVKTQFKQVPGKHFGLRESYFFYGIIVKTD